MPTSAGSTGCASIRRAPSRSTRVWARYTPTMKNEPCAKFTMRVTPKMIDRPAATSTTGSAARPSRPSVRFTALEKPTMVKAAKAT